MKPIRILSLTLELLGEIDNYLSFSFLRRYHSPGEFQLVTNRKVQNADKLNIDQLIMLGADKYKTGIIRHKEINKRTGRRNPNSKRLYTRCYYKTKNYYSTR